jgi:predicted membrane protein
LLGAVVIDTDPLSVLITAPLDDVLVLFGEELFVPELLFKDVAASVLPLLIVLLLFTKYSPPPIAATIATSDKSIFCCFVILILFLIINQLAVIYILTCNLYLTCNL